MTKTKMSVILAALALTLAGCVNVNVNINKNGAEQNERCQRGAGCCDGFFHDMHLLGFLPAGTVVRSGPFAAPALFFLQLRTRADPFA